MPLAFTLVQLTAPSQWETSTPLITDPLAHDDA